MTGGPSGKLVFKSYLEALNKHFQELCSRLAGKLRRGQSASSKSEILGHSPDSCLLRGLTTEKRGGRRPSPGQTVGTKAVRIHR